MAQQTAIDWLIKEIESLITIETFQRWKVLKEKAKQMEMEQMKIIDEEIENQSDKQTSIEWLIKELKLEGYDHTIKVAKKMYDKEIDECSKKHSIQKINPSDFIDEMFKNAGRRD